MVRTVLVVGICSLLALTLHDGETRAAEKPEDVFRILFRGRCTRNLAFEPTFLDRYKAGADQRGRRYRIRGCRLGEGWQEQGPVLGGWP